ETGDKTELNRVRPNTEHDWNCRGRGLCRERRRNGNCDDHCHLTAHQLRRHFRQSAAAFRSNRTDGGPQVLPPARATVPPWLPVKRARVSYLPASCALAPPACAAQSSCRREPCTGRSAWLLLGRACLSACIEHRSEEQRSP